MESLVQLKEVPDVDGSLARRCKLADSHLSGGLFALPLSEESWCWAGPVWRMHPLSNE